MNRPDIAAIVLTFNATWIATAAVMMTLFMRVEWLGDDARPMRNGLIVVAATFTGMAVAAWVYTWLA